MTPFDQEAKRLAEIRERWRARGLMPCKRCRDTGKIAYRRNVISYETDSVDEQLDAWSSMECPECKGAALHATADVGTLLDLLADRDKELLAMERDAESASTLLKKYGIITPFGIPDRDELLQQIADRDRQLADSLAIQKAEKESLLAEVAKVADRDREIGELKDRIKVAIGL